MTAPLRSSLGTWLRLGLYGRHDRHKLALGALLLDHVGLEPNVARDPRVRLPKQIREEPNPPSVEHVEGILEALGEKWRLLFVALEQGGLRLGEAVGLR